MRLRGRTSGISPGVFPMMDASSSGDASFHKSTPQSCRSNSTVPVAFLNLQFEGVPNAAYGASAGGEFITGCIATGSVYAAYLWSSADDLTILPSTGTPVRDTFGMDVSDDGAVVVGAADYYDYTAGIRYAQAYRWVGGATPTALPSTPGKDDFSIARAVSADGDIVVGEAAADVVPPYDAEYLDSYFDRYTKFRAVYWDEDDEIHVLQDELPVLYGIDLEGWLLSSARGVSSNGMRIAGAGLWTPDSNIFYEVGWGVRPIRNLASNHSDDTVRH